MESIVYLGLRTTIGVLWNIIGSSYYLIGKEILNMAIAEKNRITAKRIGELAGCCQQAVSAVLSGRNPSKVSAEKREKILALARDLNYQPNRAALSLAGHPTKLVGVIPHFHGLGNAMVMSLSAHLTALGYSMIAAPVVLPSQTRSIPGDLISCGAEGIIINETMGKDFSHSGCPLPSVLISYKQYDVDYDWEDGGRLAAEHFIGHGHKSIAFLHSGSCYSTDLLLKGIRHCLRDHGIAFRDAWSVDLVHNPRGDEQILDLIRRQKITAFFTISEMMTGRLCLFLRKNGIRVPDDVALICSRGTFYTEVIGNGLTSLVYPVSAVCKAAAEILRDKIKNHTLNRRENPVLIKSGLHIGGSCGCRPAGMGRVFWEETSHLSLDHGDDRYLYPEPECGKETM